jgi:hypothetical protein
MSKYFDIQYAYASARALFRPKMKTAKEFSPSHRWWLSEGQILNLLREMN